jgi:hypothetical protein
MVGRSTMRGEHGYPGKAFEGASDVSPRHGGSVAAAS